MASSTRLPRLLATLAKRQQTFSARFLHSTIWRAYPRRRIGIPPPTSLVQRGRLEEDSEEWMEEIPVEERDGLGSSSMGHLLLRQQRHLLKYLRLIEYDMPNLVRACYHSHLLICSFLTAI